MNGAVSFAPKMVDSSLLLFFFPLARGLLGRLAANLHDVSAWPLLLVFLFTAVKIVRDAAMNDLVPLFVMVFVCVSVWHKHCDECETPNDQADRCRPDAKHGQRKGQNQS